MKNNHYSHSKTAFLANPIPIAGFRYYAGPADNLQRDRPPVPQLTLPPTAQSISNGLFTPSPPWRSTCV